MVRKMCVVCATTTPFPMLFLLSYLIFYRTQDRRKNWRMKASTVELGGESIFVARATVVAANKLPPAKTAIIWSESRDFKPDQP